MKTRNKSGRSAAGVVAAALLAASLTAGGTLRADEPSAELPATLQGMALRNHSDGAEAAERIARLHGKQVAPRESHIGHYGEGAEHAMLYLSRFATPAEAEALLTRMSEHIGKASGPYVHHTHFAVGATEIHLVLGEGRVHYFFARGPALYWLAVIPAMAPGALAEILGVDAGEVPALGTLLGATE